MSTSILENFRINNISAARELAIRREKKGVFAVLQYFNHKGENEKIEFNAQVFLLGLLISNSASLKPSYSVI